jgi:phosphatidylethanolamine/phosphatidyl-N-methylethanolamine N-methyltransferase
MTRLDADAVRTAYRRQAPSYDFAFGAVSAWARRGAVSAVNALPGERVLEVGVGTGLALPYYSADRRITGIDLSADMLARARKRVTTLGLEHVEALLERDAEATGLPAESFDIAVAMFVASVVPHPRRLLAELRRLVRPGGHILFVNHFAAAGGVRLAVEKGLAGLSRTLGWHPDFARSDLLDAGAMAEARFSNLPPAGFFTLVQLPRP